MNTFKIKTTFLDEDGFLIEKEVMTTAADSQEEAYDNIEKEIEDNYDMYPSNNLEFELIDVY